jgi:pimeloyl-ACP methyl ester carboxylesterase
MMRGRTLVALAAAAVFFAIPSAAEAQLSLHGCKHVQCGRLSVPLDRSGATAGSISLYVERQRALRPPGRGVTLLLAGGPGQPATGAYNDRSDDPYGEFRRLTPLNDVVALDGRGTGRSGLLRCPELERANLVDAGAEAAACANRLGPKRGFYRTSDSVDDIEAVRAALGVDKLTLIGVSYGTFLAQAYAVRYPTHVERVLLDSVLDVSGWDPFYLDIFGAVPRVLEAVCRATCAAFTRDEVADLGRLVTRLARGSLHGQVTLPNGHRHRSALTRPELFFTLVSGDLDELLRASFPGAVKSALRGDLDPILRLKRHAQLSEGSGSPRDFSSALYAATTCEEIPFPWPRFSDPATRFGPIHAAIAQIPEDALYPFDRATDEGNDFIRMCRRWPEASPAPAYPPPAGSLPDVPVLMLDGQMDLRTPIEGARRAASRWPHAQVLTIPNTGHSVLTADYSRCTHNAAVRFLRGQTVAARCPHSAQFFFALPPAPRSLNELRAAPGVRGRRGQAISAAELTLFDVTVEFLSTALSGNSLDLHGGGLRGGRWSLNLNKRDPVLRLHGVEYLPGVRVSGAVQKIGTRHEHSVLRLSGPRTPAGVLRIGSKLITGRLGGRRIRSRIPGSGSSASAAAAGSPVTRAQLLRMARRLAHRPRLY